MSVHYRSSLLCPTSVVADILYLSPGAWILTSGLRFGITKHLGQAVRDHSLASTSSKVRVVAIGIAPWTMIHNRDMLLTARVSIVLDVKQLAQLLFRIFTLNK